MKRFPLALALAVLPVAAMAAEPSQPVAPSDGVQWVWCERDAQGATAAWMPQRAEVVISGTSLSGRLYLDHKEYARLSGAVKPASTTATADGATTRVWEITATESTAGAAAPWRSLQLTGVYTKHQSTAANAGARGSYEVLTLSKVGEDHAALVISRVQSASPLRVAAR
jgi:hypothetical protein